MINIGLGLQICEIRIHSESHARAMKEFQDCQTSAENSLTGFGLCSGMRLYGVKASRKSG